MSGDAGTENALRNNRGSRRQTWLLAGLLTILLLGLPVAAWLDLRVLTSEMLQRQSDDAGGIINGIRTFYTEEILTRVAEAGGQVTFSHDFRDKHGAIPIPATFSIELGKVISARDGITSYRFVSDYPFKGRGPNNLDEFERNALAEFRAGRTQNVWDVTGGVTDRTVRLATPVHMTEACVACHNSHANSPKTDWKVGDVRGIQVITSQQQLESGLFAFKYLFAYFLFAGGTSVLVLSMQQRQNRRIETAYASLHSSNAELARTQEALQSSFEVMESDLGEARHFQERMLPQVFPRPDVMECASSFRPARQVGGDFFDVFGLPDGRVALIMADVSDKGVKAAFFTAVTRSTLLDIAKTGDGPARVLAQVNARLVAQNPSELFVTIVYGIVDPERQTFTFANCGHPSPILRTADGEARPLHCEPCPPLAMIADIDIDEVAVPYAPGDTLCIFTDGIPDSGVDRGTAYGEAGLLGTIGRPDLQSPLEICRSVEQEIEARDGDEPFDDAAFLAIQFRRRSDRSGNH